MSAAHMRRSHAYLILHKDLPTAGQYRLHDLILPASRYIMSRVFSVICGGLLLRHVIGS